MQWMVFPRGERERKKRGEKKKNRTGHHNRKHNKQSPSLHSSDIFYSESNLIPTSRHGEHQQNANVPQLRRDRGSLSKNHKSFSSTTVSYFSL